MADDYHIKSTSKSTAEVRDRVLSAGATTRKVLRAELVENVKDPTAAVRATIPHQRKGKHDEWEDIGAKPLTKLKAGEAVKLGLNTAETLKLHQELQNLFQVYREQGIVWGETDLVVGPQSEIIKLPEKRRQVIQALLSEEHGEEVWAELTGQHPDLATRLSYARLHQQRADVLKEFADGLASDRDEGFWQSFFERNTWIFGYGLKYQFLHTIQAQPHYGGTARSGKGGQRGDYLAATAAENRFTVLVEIKTPGTDLLGSQYRGGAYRPSPDLAGGVSQLQTNCRTWELQGARADENRDLDTEGILTVQPKGILVIGHTQRLAEDGKNKLNRQKSFELYRRNLANPEVLTFDELFQRARYIVEHDTTSQPQ